MKGRTYPTLPCFESAEGGSETPALSLLEDAFAFVGHQLEEHLDVLEGYVGSAVGIRSLGGFVGFKQLLTKRVPGVLNSEVTVGGVWSDGLVVDPVEGFGRLRNAFVIVVELIKLCGDVTMFGRLLLRAIDRLSRLTSCA